MAAPRQVSALVQLAGIAVAVLLMKPLAYLILVLALAWIVVVSVWMFRQPPSEA